MLSAAPLHRNHRDRVLGYQGRSFQRSQHCASASLYWHILKTSQRRLQHIVWNMNTTGFKSDCAAPWRARVVPCAVAPRIARRDILLATTTSIALCTSNNATAAETKPKKPAGPLTSALCDADCVAGLPERVKLPSGLEYVDIVPGTGTKPITGYQITVNYVAMSPEGRAFDSSIEKGTPYDIRYGVGSVIPGLDEGLKTMKTGGIRRLYIPGDLAFPKGLPSAAGRPRIPPASPVIFDVQLVYIPGFDDEDE